MRSQNDGQMRKFLKSSNNLNDVKSQAKEGAEDRNERIILFLVLFGFVIAFCAGSFIS